ncbi:Uncharacterized protein dnl_57590 [Desulfonema limicola]|uniref:Uncharacterized protein n=1 Tax=Desulfonema limicola TaxID=45656 RepID=A0A975BDH8_9BACT|nr:Uncharacterized protein dnl_57590 [Desulfonema limicola]
MSFLLIFRKFLFQGKRFINCYPRSIGNNSTEHINITEKNILFQCINQKYNMNIILVNKGCRILLCFYGKTVAPPYVEALCLFIFIFPG